MRNRTTALFTLATVLGLAALGFQNCSKVSFDEGTELVSGVSIPIENLALKIIPANGLGPMVNR